MGLQPQRIHNGLINMKIKFYYQSGNSSSTRFTKFEVLIIKNWFIKKKIPLFNFETRLTSVLTEYAKGGDFPKNLFLYDVSSTM